jgi:hypothetical protein
MSASLCVFCHRVIGNDPWATVLHDGVYVFYHVGCKEEQAVRLSAKQMCDRIDDVLLELFPQTEEQK